MCLEKIVLVFMNHLHDSLHKISLLFVILFGRSQVTKDGYPALLSSCWYLDHLSTGGDWRKYYTCDPHDFSGDAEQKKLVLGGEACMWAEVVDNGNILQRLILEAQSFKPQNKFYIYL